MIPPSSSWLTKDQLAERFGLDSVHGINRNAASGDWPSHKVLGQLRFSPEDVAAIEELLTHPATRRRRQAAPPPQPRRTQRPAAASAKGREYGEHTDLPIRDRRAQQSASKAGGFADLEDRPIRDRGTT